MARCRAQALRRSHFGANRCMNRCGHGDSIRPGRQGRGRAPGPPPRPTRWSPDYLCRETQASAASDGAGGASTQTQTGSGHGSERVGGQASHRQLRLVRMGAPRAGLRRVRNADVRPLHHAGPTPGTRLPMRGHPRTQRVACAALDILFFHSTWHNQNFKSTSVRGPRQGMDVGHTVAPSLPCVNGLSALHQLSSEAKQPHHPKQR